MKPLRSLHTPLLLAALAAGMALPAQAASAATVSATASQQAQVQVFPLDCGRIDVKDMDMFADDGTYKNVSAQLVVSCYLIRHPQGDLLWDTGIGDQFAGSKGVTLIPGNIVAHVPVTLQSQLKKRGTSLAGIRYLAFSHEHIDHIGNANALTGATWLLNPKEHAWAIKQDGKDGQPPPLLAGADRAKIRPVTGDLDVFGDGTVRILQTPGHTPGHQSLLVIPGSGQPLILTGDVWHSYANFRHNRVPSFNSSRSDTLAAMQRLRALARDTGARIVIGHAPEDFMLQR